VALSVGPLLGSAFVGLLWSLAASRFRDANADKTADLEVVLNDKLGVSYGQIVRPVAPTQTVYSVGGQPQGMAQAVPGIPQPPRPQLASQAVHQVSNEPKF
jgi:hypothetical protein